MSLPKRLERQIPSYLVAEDYPESHTLASCGWPSSQRGRPKESPLISGCVRGGAPCRPCGAAIDSKGFLKFRVQSWSFRTEVLTTRKNGGIGEGPNSVGKQDLASPNAASGQNQNAFALGCTQLRPNRSGQNKIPRSSS